MRRQLIIISIALFSAFFFTLTSSAKNAENQTLTMPSPQSEKPAPEKQNNTSPLGASGLDPTYVPQKVAPSTEYHLPPSMSATLAFSLVNDLESDTTNWLGIHVVPWMNATNRLQVGIDIHDKIGLLEGAYHFLVSRTRSRLYWGAGMSMRIDSEDKLSNIVENENYYAFAVGGWDYQIARLHSLRLEAGFHQGIDDHFIKGLFGYTYHF